MGIKTKIILTTISILGILIFAKPIINILSIDNIDYLFQKIFSYSSFSNLLAPTLIFLLRFISIIIPIIPGTYCSIISGYLFGITNGLLLIFIADLISCTTCFYLSRRYGRKLVQRLIGLAYMSRVENFSKRNLEGNIFLMTGFLMTQFFDFICYGIGLTKIPFRKFLPALILSIIISDTPFVSAGFSLKGLKSINFKEIISGETSAMSGPYILIFAISVTTIFLLALINYLVSRRERINSKSYQ